MTEQSIKDIVIDTNVMRLYDTPKDPKFSAFFSWLRSEGTLTMSKKLLMEYGGSTNAKIFVLINELQRKGRYNLINNQRLKEFNEDRHYRYTCNEKDKNHARLVFLSHRKKLIGFDNPLLRDVNNFHRVDGVKPCACNSPDYCCL